LGYTVHCAYSPPRIRDCCVDTPIHEKVEAAVGNPTTTSERVVCVKTADPVETLPRMKNELPAVAGAVTLKYIFVPFKPGSSLIVVTAVPPVTTGAAKSDAIPEITPVPSRTVIVQMTTSLVRTRVDCELDPKHERVDATVARLRAYIVSGDPLTACPLLARFMETENGPDAAGAETLKVMRLPSPVPPTTSGDKTTPDDMIGFEKSVV